MNQNYKAVLLTILTLSVFTLVIIELTGISSNSLNALWHNKQSGNAGQGRANQITDPRMQQVSAMPRTTMKFYETRYDFGAIPSDKPVTHIFRLKNTGQNPLMIAKADVSCGCTVPKFSLDPIAPGADGEITVTFNPKGKSGAQNKNIIVHSNADPEAVSIGFNADVK